MTQHQPHLLNKVALITGGAKGIGKATALKLAAEGCDLFIIYFNSSDEAEQVCEQVRKLGRQAYAHQANVADMASLKESLEAFKSHYEQLDILVSNAASGVLKPAMKMSTKHWRWCMETNTLALNHLCQLYTPLMKKGSSIIALSSLGAARAIPNYAFIGASKAALEALVRSLSLELAPLEISINTISAGVVDTDALKYFPNRSQLLDEYQSRSLAKESLQPTHVADAIYLLCLPEAKMIKGQTIFVDAGYATIG